MIRLHEISAKLLDIPQKTKTTLLFWLGAALVGIAAVTLAAAADWAANGFHWIQRRWWWAPLLLVPAGGVLITWIMHRCGPGANGSGIPQAKAALQASNHPLVTRHLLSLRIAAMKALGIILGLFSGFVLGREGPTVQIGASIMYSLRQLLPHDSAEMRRQLILVGGAAGIAAAFNTPLAGIVFAFEEMARSVEEKTSGKLLGAVILAGLVSLAIEGDYIYFGRIHAPAFVFASSELIPVVLISVLCGLMGGAFAWLCLNIKVWLPIPVQIWQKKRPYAFVAACGFFIAVLGMIAPIHGSGAEVTRAAIENHQSLPWYFLPLKLLGLLATFLTGLPGGIFAPSLAMGAGVGSWFAPFFAANVTVKLMAIGMAAMLAAVTRAPITAAIILMEMTDGHSMVISIMVATMIASTVARRFNANLYHELAERALAQLKLGEVDDAPAKRAKDHDVA
ncbi:chloride channel protein [Chitinibacter sp. SCUT-21]|uniref:chloride channel protein n=1 Tax=Chitinibacter sp. SCUT-21 TaxID=2970891 RepID=UPI0035A5CACD